MLKRLFLSIIFLTISVYSQNEDKYAQIDELMLKLVEQNASLLSPGYYNDGLKAYNLLREDIESGYTTEELDSDTDDIIVDFSMADTISLNAGDFFSDIIDLRNNCISLEAEKYSQNNWQKAEAAFKEAIYQYNDDYEDRDTEDAEEYALEAKELYTTAQSFAEKANEIGNEWTYYKNAKAANAELLSPDVFAEAEEYRSKALEMISDGEDISSIEEVISTSQFLFEESVVNANDNSSACASILEAREQALEKNAPILAPQYWSYAEKIFRRACLEYIKRDEDFWDTAIEAENYYLDAEKTALKAFYMGKVDRAIDEALYNDAEEYAPQTLARCEHLKDKTLKKIEIVNDYDDEILTLANEAEMEGRHASYISILAKRLIKEERTSEEIVLASEDYIAQIAKELDIKPDFSNGYEATTNAIMELISSGEVKLNKPDNILSNDYSAPVNPSDYDDSYYDEYNKKVDEYSTGNNSNYGDSPSYGNDDELDEIFTASEAEIITEDDMITIRLIGLIFPAAVTRLDERDYALLDKVAKALNIYPDNEVEINAHTDSRASRNFNNSLSQERADAVMNYLSDRVSNSMSATGYGESDPIADNSTEEGRARNRRIEVIIMKD